MTPYLRRALASLACATMLVVAGCESNDDPAVASGVLTPDDLPAKPSATAQDVAVPNLTPECELNGEARWDDSRFDAEVVSYSGVGGDTIFSAIWSWINEPRAVSAAQELTFLDEAWRRCPAATNNPASGTLTEIHLGAGKFGFIAADAQGKILGIQAYATTGETTVQVTVVPEDGQRPDIDLAGLLDKAVKRAATQS